MLCGVEGKPGPTGCGKHHPGGPAKCFFLHPNFVPGHMNYMLRGIHSRRAACTPPLEDLSAQYPCIARGAAAVSRATPAGVAASAKLASAGANLAAAAAAAAAWRAMAVDEAEAAVPQLDTVPPPEPEEEAEQDDEAHRMQAVAERLQAAKTRGDNDIFKQFDQINSALAELQRAMK